MKHFYFSQLWTCLISWVVAAIYLKFDGYFSGLNFVLFLTFFIMVPPLFSYYYYKIEEIELPISFKWDKNYPKAIASAIVFILITFILSAPFFELRPLTEILAIAPDITKKMSPELALFFSLVYWLVLSILSGLTIQFLWTLCVEGMWRGYAWEKLKRYGFWPASIISGAFCGLWHVPLILMGLFYPDDPNLGIAWKVVFAILISPVLMYFRLLTNNVLVSCVFYGVLLASGNMFVILFKSTQYLCVGVQGLTGFATCILFNLYVWIKLKKNPYILFEV